MITLLNADPAFQGLFVGRSDGGFTFVTDHADGTRIKEIVPEPRVVTNTIVDPSGQVIEVSEAPDDVYDPTMRPWYSLALESDGAAWTDSYIFFDSQQPGVTVAMPVVSSTVSGVVGLDLSVQSLSLFLERLDTSENSVALVMDSTGRVLAFSRPDSALIQDGDKMRLAELSELDSPAIVEAAARFLTNGGSPDQYSTFDIDDVTYLASFRTLASGVNWTVGVVAPESDYLGVIDESERDLTGLILLIGSAAVLAGFVLTRKIAQPLEKMRMRAEAALAGETLQPRYPAKFREIELADRAMYMAQEQLEARVHERTEALELEVEQRRIAELAAEQASRAKSEFLARVSHELRTPLTAIIGFASILDAEFEGLDEDEIGPTAVSTIQTSAGHLLELINDILDVARIESGSEVIDEKLVHIEPLFAEVEDMLSALADERGVTISRHVPNGVAGVMGDERRLRQILINLAGNAIKFTSEGGRVELSATGARDGSLHLDVSDTGSGMSEGTDRRSSDTVRTGHRL